MNRRARQRATPSRGGVMLDDDIFTASTYPTCWLRRDGARPDHAPNGERRLLMARGDISDRELSATFAGDDDADSNRYYA